jgi:hypothetical protein
MPATLFSLVGFSIQAPAPPFPIFVCANALVGFSMTLQAIHSNNYVSNLPKSLSRLGILHCGYGRYCIRFIIH